MGTKVPPIRGFTDLTSETFKDAIANDKQVVMVEFYRDSCSSCHMFNATLLDVKDRLGDSVPAYRLNFDLHAEPARAYQIVGAPTTAFFYQGKHIGSIVGAMEMKYFIMQFAPIKAALAEQNVAISLT